MIKLQTPVVSDRARVSISYDDRIFMLGSCFTDEVGKRMADWGFDVHINPFGTIYNPASIAQSIGRLLSGEPFTESDCVQMGSGSKKFCSFCHHTSFARDTREEFLANANSKLEEAAGLFKTCNKIIITLGTAWCFRHIGSGAAEGGSGRIVSNCLKRDAKEFVRERLSVERCTALLQKTADICGKDIIFTVSPIRHMADGAHGNQLSKSTLLLAVDNLVGNIDYFPSYEIMMDELRDYRFYTEDMVHPSQQAVSYIADRFLEWTLPEKEKQRLEAGKKAWRQSLHISK